MDEKLLKRIDKSNREMMKQLNKVAKLLTIVILSNENDMTKFNLEDSKERMKLLLKARTDDQRLKDTSLRGYE